MTFFEKVQHEGLLPANTIQYRITCINVMNVESFICIDSLLPVYGTF